MEDDCLVLDLSEECLNYNKNDEKSKNNLINWKIGIYCAIGGIIGGFTGAKLLNKVSDKYLKLIFVIFLLYASYNILF